MPQAENKLRGVSDRDSEAEILRAITPNGPSRLAGNVLRFRLRSVTQSECKQGVTRGYDDILFAVYLVGDRCSDRFASEVSFPE